MLFQFLLSVLNVSRCYVYIGNYKKKILTKIYCILTNVIFLVKIMNLFGSLSVVIFDDAEGIWKAIVVSTVHVTDYRGINKGKKTNHLLEVCLQGLFGNGFKGIVLIKSVNGSFTCKECLEMVLQPLCL